MSIDPRFMDLAVFLIALAFGFIAFSQITYPLVTLIPKVRKLMEEHQSERTMLLYLLLLAPVIWTIVLACSIVLVFRYYGAYSKTYLMGLGIVLILVIFNLYKRNRDIEEEFLFRLKNCIRLSEEESIFKKYPRDKL